MVYSMAEEYCKSRQGGSLAVFSDKFDWDCIPRDEWFWTDDKKGTVWGRNLYLPKYVKILSLYNMHIYCDQ